MVYGLQMGLEKTTVSTFPLPTPSVVGRCMCSSAPKERKATCLNKNICFYHFPLPQIRFVVIISHLGVKILQWERLQSVVLPRTLAFVSFRTIPSFHNAQPWLRPAKADFNVKRIRYISASSGLFKIKLRNLQKDSYHGELSRRKLVGAPSPQVQSAVVTNVLA